MEKYIMENPIHRICPVFLTIMLVMTSLTTGCINENTRIVTITRYVCYDGSVVSDNHNCPREEAMKIISNRYVCWNRDIVNDPAECPIPNTTTLSVTAYSPATTTLTDISISTVPLVATTTMTSSTSTSVFSTSTTTTAGTTHDYCLELGCPAGTRFVASKNSNKYHYCNCRWARKIKPKNLVCYRSFEDALSHDKEPCSVCKPPK